MKVGIIGCGFIAEVHIQALRAVGQEVFAIVGREREKTEEFAEKWGIPHVCTDYRDFLKVGVEAVHICTPPMLHFLPARFFLENKIPVVCEKPLCLKESEAEELKKVHRVIGKALDGAPHAVWIVLDATTGQNALTQAQAFQNTVSVNGVILAKLDSSAKGGMAFAVTQSLKLPILYAGLGERAEDLVRFDREKFVDGIVGE